MIGVPPSGGSLVVSFFTFEKRKAEHGKTATDSITN